MLCKGITFIFVQIVCRIRLMERREVGMDIKVSQNKTSFLTIH